MNYYILVTVSLFLFVAVIAVSKVREQRFLLLDETVNEILYWWKKRYVLLPGTSIRLRIEKGYLYLYFGNYNFSEISREFSDSLLKELGKQFENRGYDIVERKDGIEITYPSKKEAT